MLENFKKVDNPLTVIAIFAGVAEVSMSAVAIFNSDLRATFIWFVMIFPVLLILLFFVTLNLNHKVLYAPSDFRDDSTFLALIRPTEVASRNIGAAVEKLEEIKRGVSADAATEIAEVVAGLNTLTQDQQLLAELTLHQVEIMEFVWKSGTADVTKIMTLSIDVSPMTAALNDLLRRNLLRYSPDAANYMLTPEGEAFIYRVLSPGFAP